jgi:hypothetical protein
MKLNEIKNLTNDELRLRVALCDSWIRHVRPEYNDFTKDGYEPPSKYAPRYTNSGVQEFWAIPEYPTDLNAMHEAEKRMTQPQAQEYVDQLDRMCRDVTSQDNVFSTARQRAEAFVLIMERYVCNA